MSKKVKTYYLFIDFETTDLNFNTDGTPIENKILESAFILTDRYLNKIKEDNIVIHLSQEDIDNYIPERVKKIHEKNNLLKDSLSSEFTVNYLDNYLYNILTEFVPSDSRIILVGNTINFDYEVIRRHLPETYQKIYHRTLDISAIREAIAIIRPNFIKQSTKKKIYLHRAYEDIKESFNELDDYLDLLEKIKF